MRAARRSGRGRFRSATTGPSPPRCRSRPARRWAPTSSGPSRDHLRRGVHRQQLPGRGVPAAAVQGGRHARPRGELISGQALQGRVLARYLFGGAMPGATVRWTATRTTEDFQPPDNPGFAFGIATWEWSDETPGPSTEVIGAGEGKTDAQGGFEIAAGQVESPGGRSAARHARGRGGRREPAAHRQPGRGPRAPGRALRRRPAAERGGLRRGGQAGLARGGGGLAGRQAPEGRGASSPCSGATGSSSGRRPPATGGRRSASRWRSRSPPAR